MHTRLPRRDSVSIFQPPLGFTDKAFLTNPPLASPVDDLPMINLQRKAKEEWEDATLKGAELEEARRRREERGLEMEKEREHWRRELGDNENIVYFERL